MKSKSMTRQFEMDLSREPFALMSQTGIDHDREQAQRAQKESDRAHDAKAQWWFEQMRLAVERSQ